ncbi:MAG: rod shape-determining protein MreD [Phycisphaerae bacterium]
MPWGAFTLVLVVVYVLQTAAVRLLELPAVDLLLAFALFCGLAAGTHDARLAGWIVGFAQDLGSGGPLGPHAVALGLACWILTALRAAVNLHLWWARLAGAFVAALAAQTLLLIHERWWQGLNDGSAFGAVLTLVAYSLIAALVAAGLTQLPIFLAWDRRRRHYPRARW